jgi:hypothetical protein
MADETTSPAGTDDPPETAQATGDSGHAASDTDGFDWRGWLLVATLAVSFIVIPWSIVGLQEAQGLISALGLSLRDTYLVLPLLPAFVLGFVAVWTAVRSRQS